MEGNDSMTGGADYEFEWDCGKRVKGEPHER